MIAPLERFVILGWSITTLFYMTDNYEDDCEASVLSIVFILMLYWMVFMSSSDHSIYGIYAIEMMKSDDEITELEVDEREIIV